MVEAYRQAAEGKFSLTDPVTFRDDDKTPGSGILSTHFSGGATFSLRDAIRLMIAYSDNSATNLVLAKIGLPATGEQMEKLGLANTKVHAFVFRPNSSIAPERSRQFGLGSTTAAEMIRLLEMLHEKKLVSAEACDEMLGHLRACQDKRLSRLLPAGVKVAHKTGSVAAVRTDAGLIESKSGPIAICVLTRNNKDQRWTEENAAEVLTSRIAKEVHDYFERGQQVATDQASGRRRPPGDPNLRQGATGELVQALQRTLNARSTPSPELTVDGDFGPATEAAVKAFQRANQLTVSGIADAATLKALGPLRFDDAVQPEPDTINSESLTRENRESLDDPPLTTCKAWVIADAKSGNLLHGSREADKLDMASTTKMMTAYIVCELARSDPKVLAEVITFSETADKTPGSTADVRAGEKVSVGELLYGLLLPSGNDAATAYAEHFGPRLAAAVNGGNSATESATPARGFIDEMNRRAAALGMNETHYENPHGLTARGHQSSARDLAKLAHAAMQNPLFRQYVSTRQHGSKVTGEGGYERNLVWRNTNKLLAIDGYSGVKTGTTNAAGACLVAWGERDGRELIVVVLGSASSDARYVDSRNLFRWAWARGK
jgi:D-alanyl-D-alanine carboxypeptidase (penicillin-binding protein 5/6)